MNDPDNPKGMQIRRARLEGESWPIYFVDVLMWPYTERYYNRFFARMHSDGHRIEFIPDVVFLVEDQWVLVVRGTRPEVESALSGITLDGITEEFSIRPVSTRTIPDRTEGKLVGMAYFNPVAQRVDPRAGHHSTPKSPRRVMSSFEAFDRAGGVAEILDEKAVRRKFSVLRNPVDMILERVRPGS